MEIRFGQIANAVRRFWWLPLVLALLLGGLAFGIGAILPASYSATSQLLVPPLDENSASIIPDGQRANTYLQLVTSGPVLDRVIDDLDLPMDREQLRDKITVVLLPNTQIIEVRVSDSTAQRSADIANSVTQNFEQVVGDLTVGQFRSYRDNLAQQLVSLESRQTEIDNRLAEIDTDANADNADVQAEVSRLRSERLTLSQTIADIQGTIRNIDSQIVSASAPVVVADQAQPAKKSDSPQPALLAVVGAFLGGLIGAAAALFLELTDKTLRRDDDVSLLTGGRVLGRLSASASDGDLAVIDGRLRAINAPVDSPAVVLASAVGEINTAEIAGSATGDGVPGDSALDTFRGDHRIVPVGGILTDPEALVKASEAKSVVLVVRQNATRLEDIQSALDVLEASGVHLLGTLVVE